jgi:hypothetical protein
MDFILLIPPSINKKIAFGSISILSAMAMLGGSAYATFTTTAVATATTVDTLNPSLTVSVNGATPAQSEAGATITGLIPGTPGSSETIVVANTDTNGADSPLAINLQLTADTGNTLPGPDLTITVNCGSNGNTTQSYSNWISTGAPFGSLAPGTNMTCTLTPELNAGIGNSDINLTAIFDATFTGSAGS